MLQLLNNKRDKKPKATSRSMRLTLARSRPSLVQATPYDVATPHFDTTISPMTMFRPVPEPAVVGCVSFK